MFSRIRVPCLRQVLGLRRIIVASTAPYDAFEHCNVLICLISCKFWRCSALHVAIVSSVTFTHTVPSILSLYCRILLVRNWILLKSCMRVWEFNEWEHYNNNILGVVTILASLSQSSNGKCFPRRTSRYDALTGDARSIYRLLAARILQNDGLPVMVHGDIVNPSEYFLTCAILGDARKRTLY